MRPDPWQQKKSRQYQAKRKTKGSEVKAERIVDAVKTEKSLGGFKFVAPQPVQAEVRDGTDSEAESEYDVNDIEDLDLGSLKIASPVFDDSIRLPVWKRMENVAHIVDIIA